jgi:hypothetical protein
VHFSGVQREFFEHMEPSEVEALAAVFARFKPNAGEDCTP